MWLAVAKKPHDGDTCHLEKLGILSSYTRLVLAPSSIICEKVMRVSEDISSCNTCSGDSRPAHVSMTENKQHINTYYPISVSNIIRMKGAPSAPANHQSRETEQAQTFKTESYIQEC